MEITLQPEDNSRLANLCGALDENIKQIETALEVILIAVVVHLISAKTQQYAISRAVDRETSMCAQKTSRT